MNDSFKKMAPFLTFFIVLFFVIGSYIIYKNETKTIEERIYNRLEHSVYYFKEYFSISESFLYTMKYTIEDKFKLKEACIHSSFKDLKTEDDRNIYFIKNERCSLTGIGNPDNFSKELVNEINSSLYLKPIFFAAKKIVPDLKKIYYKSANKFIFISPNFESHYKENYQFQYNATSWDDFLKQKDIDKSFLITKPYVDFHTKEHLINLSLPIDENNQFKGIVSIDIRIDTLVDYLKKITLNNHIYLTDLTNHIIASKNDFRLDEKIETKNKYMIKREIVKDQLYLTYLVDSYDLREKAFLKSSGKIFILLLLLIISIILIYLKTILIRVQHLANTDSLTNLLNRRAMKEAIENQIKISRRYNQSLSFLLIDIDYFKKVNDKYGHHIGDKVLVKVSSLFKELIRSCDIAARYGGEEFLITLANTDINEAYIMAERVRKLASHIKIKGIDLNLTVSIGCCTLKDKDSYESILKRVDKFMYEAKKRGRNNSVKEED